MTFFYLIKTILSPLRLPLITLLIVTVIGISGFMLIEKFSFSDAFYMTVITESTVGFTEVHPLSEAGRYFTIILIILSFGVFAFAVSSVTGFITGGEYKKQILKMKHFDLMNKLSNHTIICGYGRVGRKATAELLKQHIHPVIIENDVKALDEEDIHFVSGDATLDEILKEAGVEKAANIILALPSDSDNLMVIVTAKSLNPKINIVCRVSLKTNETKLRRAGANHVISPDDAGGSAMARMVMKPDLMEFTEKISTLSDDDFALDEIVYNQTGSTRLSVNDLNQKWLSGCIILGYKTKEGDFSINPSVNTEISDGTKLFVLGKKEQINSLHQKLNIL